MKFVHRTARVKPKFLLLGSKSDLQHQREVQRHEGLKLAETIDAKFLEFSNVHCNTARMATLLEQETLSFLANITTKNITSPMSSPLASPGLVRRSVSSLLR